MKQIVVALIFAMLMSNVMVAGIINPTAGENRTPPLLSDNWPMFHYDLRHSGDSKTTVPDTSNLTWSYTTSGKVISSPAVAGERVFVGSNDSKIYCLNEKDGSLIWSYTTGDSIWSSPAVANGKVIVGSSDNKVYCLNCTDGAFIWDYETDNDVLSHPVIADGRVFVGSNDKKIYCLNESSGALIWSYTTGDLVRCSPAVVDGKVFVCSWDNKVYCLNVSNGVLAWSYKTGHWLDSSPAVADEKVFVGSYDDKVYCLNESNGDLIWSYKTGDWILSSPAVANGKVFIGSKDGNAYCLNESNGNLLWSSKIGTAPYGVISSPAIADGKVVIGSCDKKIYCLNETNGALVWSYKTGGYVESSPAVAYGKVFVGSDDCKIYCFGPSVPNLLPVIDITYPATNQTVEGGVIITGSAFDVDGNDTLQTIEVRIDNGSWQAASGRTSWSYNWYTLGVDNGWHTIYAKAYDGFNPPAFDSVIVYVNNPTAKTVHNLDKDLYYSTIQAAISDASAGERIFVGSRIYYETIVIDKTITLVGENVSTTIIDGCKRGNVVNIKSNWINISEFTIKNSGSKDVGVEIFASHCTISNCNLSNNNVGLSLHSWYHAPSSYWNNITYCEISNNKATGLSIYASSNNIVADCYIFSNGAYGIQMVYSSNNLISKTTICSHWNYPGIYTNGCTNNTIANCDIHSNTGGVGFYTCSNNNTVRYSNISNNGWGVRTYDRSNGNCIHHNNFINNTNNAYDVCSNYWDDDSEGNYWDDYTGNDSDGDGIGDTPYNITGGNNHDRFPLMQPVEEEAVTDGGGEEELLALEGDEHGRFVFTYWIAVSVIMIAEIILGVFIIKKKKKVKVEKEKAELEKLTLKLRCPQCKEIFTVEAQQRPFNIKCPHCGKEGVVK